MAKSNIYFSNNVSSSLAEEISTRAGILVTKDLGCYLGVPSIHSRVTGATFSKVRERVTEKLEGWKAKHLSLAGRQVLAKPVLSTVPYYAMQSAKLPLVVCDDIDKTIRRCFIWGGDKNSRLCS